MPTRTAPRQARSARSLDLILDAAEALLHTRGLVETSTVDVAAAAGVSVGRLYYWFPDKDAVVRAVLSRAEHDLVESLADPLAELAADPASDLCERVLPAICCFFARHGGTLAVLQRGAGRADDPAGGLSRTFEQLMGRVVELRVQGVDGAERDRVAATLVRIIVAMLPPYVRADGELAQVHLRELCYVVSSYLHCRFPDEVDAPRGERAGVAVAG
jgi:AcrR family transcriptional regulator